MSHGQGEPPVEPHDPGPQGPWRPDDLSTAAEHRRADNKPPPSTADGCLAAVGKAVLIFVIGIFVLAGLVFATCFLSFRR